MKGNRFDIPALQSTSDGNAWLLTLRLRRHRASFFPSVFPSVHVLRHAKHFKEPFERIRLVLPRCTTHPNFQDRLSLGFPEDAYSRRNRANTKSTSRKCCLQDISRRVIYGIGAVISSSRVIPSPPSWTRLVICRNSIGTLSLKPNPNSIWM